MDDLLIITDTRSSLRSAIRAMRKGLADHGMIFHPDKTSIGPLARGFSFLGYTYEEGRWSIRAATLDKCVENIRKLLELTLDQGTSSDRFKQKTIHEPKKPVVEQPLSLKQKRELPYWVTNTTKPFFYPSSIRFSIFAMG